MLSDLKIHHVGYAVNRMESSRRIFAGLGYREESALCSDPLREVEILFLTKDGYRVELVAPTAASSEVSPWLARTGDTPYHVCYEVHDLTSTVRQLVAEKFVVADPPRPAVALDGRLVTFLYKVGVGLIELVEAERAP